MPAIAQGKFVVLGGASQVGSHIAEQLLAADAREVVLFDNLSLGSLEPLQPLLADARCRFVRGDVLRLNELMEPLAQADGVFSVAGIMPSTIAENPWMSLDVNVRGVQNALEACRWQRVNKIVLSSSAGVYGVMKDDPVTEDAPLRWQSAPPQLALYSATKIIGEALAQMARQQGGPDWIALRYSAVYGARQHRRAVMGGHIHESCLRVRRGEPPVIDGDGRQVQDYIHVGDVARANLMAMESDVGGEGINIVAGQDTSQARIVELVLKAAGSTLQPEYRPYVVTRLPPVTKIGLARERARRMLGWEPQVSIEEGVAGVLRWVDKQRTGGA